MLQVIRKIVKQGIAEAPTDEHAQRGPDDHIVDLVLGDRESFLTDLACNEEIGRGQTDQIHQSVPAELQGTEFEKNRVDVRVGNGLKPTHSCLMWHGGWIMSEACCQCKRVRIQRWTS